MLSNMAESGRVEIIITKQNPPEDKRSSDVRDITNNCDMLECRQSNFGTTNNIYNELDTYYINPANGGVVDVRDISIDTRFVDSMAFKNFIRSKDIMENFGLKIKASNRTRVMTVCLHRGCPWRIRAAVCVDGQTFEVRKFEPSHHCLGVNRTGNKQATCSWVAHEIEDMIKKQPNIAPKQIRNNLEMAYGLSLPYMKLWRSREQARELVFGAIDENFRWVPTLHSELLIRNSGSNITYTYDSDDHSFKSFFLSFKVCVDGFIGGCKHLIGLDACHLKSKYLGMLLSANSLDGNNGLFTIAVAVDESESKSTWEWFLENLVEAFGCIVSPLAFISDMKKDLEQAVKKVFPTTEHRVCIRHLWKNLKKNNHYPDNHKIHSIVWATANTFTRYEFDAG